MTEAADELEKLTRFYYGVIYVAPLPAGGDSFRVSADVGEWLKLHKFPAGYVLPLTADLKGLGENYHTLARSLAGKPGIGFEGRSGA